LRVAFFSALAFLVAASFAATSFEDEIAAWRKQREAGLRREGGWLTVTGLFWLRDGANTFGKAPGNQVVLVDGPERAGTLMLRNGQVTAEMGGSRRVLKPDSADVV
jgi:uncharacterized protein